MQSKLSNQDYIISIRARAAAALAGVGAALVAGFSGFYKLAPLVARNGTALVYSAWILPAV